MATASPPERMDDRHNLPVHLTTFVGREREMAEIMRLLRTSRLLTLTGAGGVGKTRLAVETASGLVEQYEDGVWLVELAPLSDPGLVPYEVASVLKVHEPHGRLLADTLASYLRPRQALLVLDNCEHVVSACAELAHALVQACPRLQILATSREPLAVPGEVDWRVPSLSMPDATPPTSVEQLAEYAAVRLFLDRATAAVSSFRLTDDNAASIAEICRRLDGIPLAIELAAVRVRVLSPAQIAARLNQLFDLLAGGSRLALPRHQTLRALVDWSYGLLGEAERRLFRRLSVFAGGWTIEAAEAICGGAGVDQVLDLTAHLVDKSLVVAEESGAARRYRLLEPMRQYAAEVLRDSQEESLLRGRHRDWFVALAEQAEPEIRGPRQRIWLDRLEVEHDNLRLALEWSSSAADGPEALLRLGGALAWFWFIRGHSREGRNWVDRALALAGGSLSARMRALAGAAWLVHQHRDLTAAERLAEASLAIARSLDDRWTIGWLLHVLGRVQYFRNDATAARALGEESLGVARECGDRWLIAWALHLIALSFHIEGNFAAARSYYEESLAIRRAIQNLDGIGTVLFLMGMAAAGQGDYEQARAEYVEGLAVTRDIDFRWVVAHCLAGFAALAAAQGQPQRAVRLASSALGISEVVGVLPIPLVQRELDRALELARPLLSEAEFGAAWAEGSQLSVEAAIAQALAVDLAGASARAQADGAGAPGQSGPASGTGGPTPPSHGLSPREVEVLRLIAAGRTNGEIAAALVVSVPTVERHVTHIYAKIGARRRADATAFALRRGLA